MGAVEGAGVWGAAVVVVCLRCNPNELNNRGTYIAGEEVGSVVRVGQRAVAAEDGTTHHSAADVPVAATSGMQTVVLRVVRHRQDV